MAIIAKRTVMSLFSDEQDVYNHQVRIVLAEKQVNVRILSVNDDEKQWEELLALNPYGTVPTLVDRDLVLYEARIIMEYLDERFPYPPLLPVDPVVRAEVRKMMYCIDRDWYSLMFIIEEGDTEKSEAARQHLQDSLLNAITAFNLDKNSQYLIGDGFSLLDCCLAPLLWRLSQLGIQLPDSAKPLKNYAECVFQRDSFQASLTETERELCVA